jgi:hypothetical protein
MTTDNRRYPCSKRALHGNVTLYVVPGLERPAWERTSASLRETFRLYANSSTLKQYTGKQNTLSARETDIATVKSPENKTKS